MLPDARHLSGIIAQLKHAVPPSASVPTNATRYVLIPTFNHFEYFDVAPTMPELP
jgi:hypothetical protein